MVTPPLKCRASNARQHFGQKGDGGLSEEWKEFAMERAGT